MKSAIDMILDVYGVVNTVAITSLLTGNIYMLEKPLNSLEADIAINALPVTNTQTQKGLVNVNIHSQNLQNVVINGKSDNTQPDLQTLNTISQAVLTLLNAFNGPDFFLNAITGG